MDESLFFLVLGGDNQLIKCKHKDLNEYFSYYLKFVSLPILDYSRWLLPRTKRRRPSSKIHSSWPALDGYYSVTK